MDLTTSIAFPSKILTAEPTLDTLQRVRASTRALHERLERRLPLLSPTLALPDYRRLLAAFHGFYHPNPNPACTLAVDGFAELAERLGAPAA